MTRVFLGVGGIFGLSRRRRGPICPFSVAANVRVISSHDCSKTLTALALAAGCPKQKLPGRTDSDTAGAAP